MPIIFQSIPHYYHTHIQKPYKIGTIYTTILHTKKRRLTDYVPSLDYKISKGQNQDSNQGKQPQAPNHDTFWALIW